MSKELILIPKAEYEKLTSQNDTKISNTCTKTSGEITDEINETKQPNTSSKVSAVNVQETLLDNSERKHSKSKSWNQKDDQDIGNNDRLIKSKAQK